MANATLMGTAFKGHTGIAELLVRGGASANITNTTGSTALQFAATFGHTNLIIDAGADPLQKTRLVRTHWIMPSHWPIRLTMIY